MARRRVRLIRTKKPRPRRKRTEARDAQKIDRAWRKFYDGYHATAWRFERLLEALLAALRDYQRSTKGVHSVKGRIKGVRSLANKSQRGRAKLNWDRTLQKVQDIVGLRIVTLDIGAKRKAINWLRSQAVQGRLRILEDRDKIYPSGYSSHHFIIQHGDETEISAEIQVRTLLEEAWGELEHPHVYKPATNEYVLDESQSARFVYLSRHLREADLLVDALLTEISQAFATVPSRPFDIDLACVPELDADLRFAIDHALESAAAKRASDPEAAIQIHRSLLADHTIAQELKRVGLRGCVTALIGFDYMVAGHRMIGSDHAGANAAYKTALELYRDGDQQLERDRSRFYDSSKSLFLTRRGMLHWYLGRRSKAMDSLNEAVAAFTPGAPTIQPFTLARVVHTLNAFQMQEVREGNQRKLAELIASADKLFGKLVREHAQFARSKPQPNELVAISALEVDLVRTTNIFAYASYLRHEREGRRTDLVRARKRIDEVQKLVSRPAFEQDLAFADTRLAVATASLDDDPDPFHLAELDLIRSRLMLQLIADDGRSLSKAVANEVLDHIRKFELRYAKSIERSLSYRED